MAGNPMVTFETASSEETKCVARLLAAHLRPGHVILLTGDLGAGKTQFVQGLAEALGVTDAVVSPTFNIVLTYDGARLPLNHFDWYRLDDAEDLEDIGFYEYVESDGVTCIEWGDRFPDKLPDEYVEISLRVVHGEMREIAACAHGESYAGVLEAWAADSCAQMEKAEL